ncbi:MAG: TonB-dependent receptor plug domain-containing protein, partial [Solimonas sp.]
GSFTRQQALDRLLARSGYNGRISGGNLVLAQEQSARPQQDSAANNGAEPALAASDTADEEIADEEIVVTGTRIRGAAPVGANLVTIDRTDIEESGRSTVQDVLGLVSQNFTGGTFETTQQGGPKHNANRSFSSSINLRGLGPGSTLSLVNGRRLAPAGLGHFVDVSTIPLAAVERVEVLADGASAAYGSDAVGGVVNFILRDDFEGAETSLRFGADGHGDVSEQMVSHGAGWSSDRFSLVAASEFRDRTGLEWNDRDFASDSNLTRFGGLDYSRPQANPGTITRIGVTPVTLAMPRGQDGTSLDASDLISGQVNRQNAVEGQSLLPEQTSHGIFLSTRFELTQRLAIFADILAGQRDAEAHRTQSFASIRVPETNYYRQLNGLFPGQGPLTIAYWFGDDLGPALSQSESRAIT